MINIAVWGIAGGVMIYGAINVTVLLIDHDVSPYVAWLLSIMIDLAMCVGLWGDRVLHTYGRTDGWVTALRWLTATMTLTLNVTRPASHHDWVGVGIHSVGPMLLLVVAEGAGSIQRQLTSIIAELEESLEELDTTGVGDGSGVSDATVQPLAASAETSTGTTFLATEAFPSSAAPAGVWGESAVFAAEARPSSAVGDPQPQTVTTGLVSRDGGMAGDVSRRDETADRLAAMPVSGDTDAVAHDGGEFPARERDGATGRPTHDEDQTKPGSWNGAAIALPVVGRDEIKREPRGEAEDPRIVMWAYFQEQRARGLHLTGADLDRAAGTNNYGRRVIRQWIDEGRINEEEASDARPPRTQSVRRRRGAPAETPQMV